MLKRLLVGLWKRRTVDVMGPPCALALLLSGWTAGHAQDLPADMQATSTGVALPAAVPAVGPLAVAAAPVRLAALPVRTGSLRWRTQDADAEAWRIVEVPTQDPMKLNERPPRALEIPAQRVSAVVRQLGLATKGCVQRVRLPSKISSEGDVSFKLQYALRCSF